MIYIMDLFLLVNYTVHFFLYLQKKHSKNQMIITLRLMNEQIEIFLSNRKKCQDHNHKIELNFDEM